MKNISDWFLKLAVVYLLCGVTLGIVMAASHNHGMAALHAHLNLLGWVSMMLFGLFYRFFPAAEQTLLAKLHFGIYVPAHLVQMITLGMLLGGNQSIEPVLGIASILVGVAILCFAINLWKHVGKPA